jgi:hypothetical protein
MPKATVSTAEEHFDLESLPGGWVKLRRMSFGQKLERTQLATDMEIEMQRGSKTQRASIEVMQQAVALFEFKHCIVDHNLFEDDDETIKIDLTTKKGLAMLDPKVGDEIGKYIDSLNNFEEDEEDLGN